MIHEIYQALSAGLGILLLAAWLRHGRLRSDHVRVSTLYAELKATYTRMEADRASLVAAQEHWQGDLAELREANRKVREAQTNLISAHTRKQSQFLELQDRQAQLGTDHERAISELDQLQTKYNQIRPQYESLRTQQAKLEERFRPVLDLDQEIAHLEELLIQLKESYREKRARYDELIRAVAAFDEEVELSELGFYQPHFDFDTSEKYKDAARSVKAQQKEMVRSKNAVVCFTNWTVDESRSKGQAMTNRAIRLTARAFNNECDAAIAKVRWNNVSRMELRIEKAFEAINKANQSQDIEISYQYFELKIKELRLAHEYREKKREEREEKAELRRQEREEATLRQEAAEAALEERRYADLLDKARKEAESANPERLQVLRGEIATLRQRLEEAHAKNERALSMAQQTRSGYVYVISNIGSFGEGVYKIGLTRRLDPMDRVRELSAASVPFGYDTHAIIYSEDAPTMESALHQAFSDQRINKINSRKEFFRVGLSDVKQEVERLFPNADFVETVEARDFRETRSIEDRLKNVREKTDARNRFPEEL